VPQFGYLTSSGGDWQCERGYKKNGGSCVALVMPANAHIGHSGNDWSCNPGYRRHGERCAQNEG
jgi:hypothetical protein